MANSSAKTKPQQSTEIAGVFDQLGCGEAQPPIPTFAGGAHLRFEACRHINQINKLKAGGSKSDYRLANLMSARVHDRRLGRAEMRPASIAAVSARKDR